MLALAVLGLEELAGPAGEERLRRTVEEMRGKVVWGPTKKTPRDVFPRLTGLRLASRMGPRGKGQCAPTTTYSVPPSSQALQL